MTGRRIAETLLSNVPGVLPKIRAWVQDVEDEAMIMGRPLSDSETKLARAVGVARPEQIRLWIVSKLPRPADPVLTSIADQLGVLGRDSAGLTIQHAVLIARAYEGDRHVIAHEFRHVHQYESFGLRDAFIDAYLAELIEFGHGAGRLELDAERAAFLYADHSVLPD